MAWESVDMGGFSVNEDLVSGRYDPETRDVQAKTFKENWKKIGEAFSREGAGILVQEFANANDNFWPI